MKSVPKTVLLLGLCIICVITGRAITAETTGRAAPPRVDFVRDVQPILAKHCLECHGPVQQKAKLRWDDRKSVLERKHPLVVAGKPDESEVIRLVTSGDPDEMMPPKGERLSKDEVAMLRQWISEGATWPDEASGKDPRYAHWAYRKPVTPALPALKNPDWARNPIDQFVLAKLEGERLLPSPEADRYTLIRRLSFDLTGLPPTVQQVDQFVGDTSPDAYPKLVDRLLASPAYGERWAAVWLDLARYADSRGYANDNARTIWRYRDWVINAINANVPYDRFTIEQIAGDLLPNATRDQVLATAFHRNTLTNDEGGTDDEEFRVAAVVDRVNTTMQVWMGATVACAQCHDHKYDPISQEEYFRLFAIFNNTEDSDKNSDAPLFATPRPETIAEVEKLEGELAQLEKQFVEPNAELESAQARWEADLAGGIKWETLTPEGFVSRDGAHPSLLADGSILVSGPQPDNDVYSLWFTGERGISAVRLEVLPDPSLPSQGPGRAESGGFILSRFLVDVNPRSGEGQTEPQRSHVVAAAADFSQKNFEIEKVVNNTNLKDRGWGIEPEAGKAHYAVFVLDAVATVTDHDSLAITLEHLSQRKKNTIGRFRLSVTDDPKVKKKYQIPPEVLAILDIPAGKRSEDQRRQLTRYYRSSVTPALAPTREKIASLKKEIEKRSVETPVMRELAADKRRKSHLLLRGSFLEKGKEVTEGTPAVFHPTPPGPVNRLTLAKWLVDPENPLTARVTVNRHWEQLFGTGLVETSDDFGLRGSNPSHPELLDWLSTEFMRQGWDAKRLVRMIVTSATYRQSSKLTPNLLERDPQNRLLARGPRFRMPAESVRDNALAVSGLLSNKMLGPSVRPVQPKLGLNAAFGGSTDWDASSGEDRFRRGLYTTWRRTVLYPSMATFDAPSRNVCSLKRPRTNTPLQALVTLNDPCYVEAAQALGRRMCKDGGGSTESKAAHGFRLCLARPPREAELRRLVSVYESAESRYAADPAAATAMATDPLGKLPDGMEAPEAAAWTVVANVLLNLDETFNRR
jgi:hypothetical protein